MGRTTYPIYLVSFPDQHLLASTFLRFQEHYESPKFRGRIFTLEQFSDWYAKTNGKFSYYADWSGFNIPDRVLRPFYDGRFDPLTVKEQAFLDLFRGIPSPYYIIGTVAGRPNDMIHELVHGLFTAFPDYRRDVIGCLRRFNLAAARKTLLGMGYCRAVLDDELNAYVTTGLDGKLKLQEARLRQVKKELLGVFMRHFGLSVGDRRNWQKLLSRIRRLKFRK